MTLPLSEQTYDHYATTAMCMHMHTVLPTHVCAHLVQGFSENFNPLQAHHYPPCPRFSGERSCLSPGTPLPTLSKVFRRAFLSFSRHTTTHLVQGFPESVLVFLQPSSGAFHLTLLILHAAQRARQRGHTLHERLLLRLTLLHPLAQLLLRLLPLYQQLQHHTQQ